MAYVKQNFETGQTLTADALNHMEDGIYANSISTPSSGTSGSSSEGSQWAGKTWYAYGTSLTATNKYTNTVKSLSGLTLVNKGISGGGIAAGSKSVKSAIMNTTDGKLAADLITLEVGANDASIALGDIYDTSDSTFCGNLNQCIRYLQENTEAQIVVISSTNAKRNTSSNTEATPEVEYGSDNHTKYEQWKATEEVAKINSVYYIPMGEGAGLGYARMNSKYLSDAIHHTDLGGKNLGSFVWSRLKNIPRWYASAVEEEEPITFYTITYKYIDTSGNQIKTPVEVKTTAGTEFTFDVSSAESIDGYTITSVTPNGAVTINSDTVVTFVYEQSSNVTSHTVTYKYVDTNGNTVKPSSSVSVISGVTLTFTTANAPSISDYKISSVTPSGAVTITGDIEVTYTYTPIVYRTVTYTYVDSTGSSIKEPTSTKVVDGTSLTLSTSTAPEIPNYIITSVSPNGNITVNSNITITYVYKAVVYRTVTYVYVDESGISLKDSTTEQVLDGTQLTFTTSNAPRITGYAVTSVAPSGTATITSDLTVTYTYTVSDTIVLNDDITWYGTLNGDGDFQVFWNSSGNPDVLTSDISATERSVGIVDVSAYQGRDIEMTYSQNYASTKPNGGYAAFFSGGTKPTGMTASQFNALVSYKIEQWNNADSSNFVSVTNNVTITKTIPSNATWLVFQHVQSSVTSGFNGNIAVIN